MNELQLELGKLSIVQLKAIKEILVHGVEGVASKFKNVADADGARALKKLNAENEQLRKANTRRDIVEAKGLEWDEDYWMSFDDGAFKFVLAKFTKLQKEATAERTSMKVPPLLSERELNALDTCREGFAELRNRRNGHND